MDNLNELNHPERFAEIASLHTKAFNWEPRNRIPLGIHVVNPEYGKGLDYNDGLNPEPFFQLQRRVLIDTLQVGSDLLPAVAINHLGDAVLTSIFGAQMLMWQSAARSLALIITHTIWTSFAGPWRSSHFTEMPSGMCETNAVHSKIGRMTSSRVSRTDRDWSCTFR
jgi:hypothetical protein